MGVDFIDYSYLKRRGIIKVDDIKSDVIDFSASQNQESPMPNSIEPTTSVPTNQVENNPFSFFDTPTTSNVFDTPSVSDAVSSNNLNNSDVSELKLKIDDLQFKLDRILEKFDNIENKLSQFESRARNF